MSYKIIKIIVESTVVELERLKIQNYKYIMDRRIDFRILHLNSVSVKDVELLEDD